MAAVFELIGESGFAGFTVEAVAERAGVGKATIYRRWPNREALILAAAERVLVTDDPPDTGDLRDDLITWYWERHRGNRDEVHGRLVGHVMVEASVNPELSRWLGTFQQGRRAAVATILERAENRGEVVPADPGMVVDMISGALIHRSLFGGKPLDRDDVERYVDVVLCTPSRRA